jgi:hypothetical protein
MWSDSAFGATFWPRRCKSGYFSAMSQTQNFDHAVFCSSVPENCLVEI